MLNFQAVAAGWSTDFWPQLFAHLWESTLFALALMPVLLLLRRAPASLRYSIWLVASAKFVVPSSLLAALAAPLLPAASGLAVTGSAWARFLAGLETVLQAPVRLLSTALADHPRLIFAATALWLGGALTFAGLWFVRRRNFARALRAATVTQRGGAARLLDRSRRRLGVRRPVVLALMPGAVEAGVWGILRPVLVLPERMPEHLRREELEAIFLHEMVHIRRWDNLVASLHMVLCCLFWFHPLVWHLDRRLLAVREEACDERVVELCGRPEPYVNGLLKALRFGVGVRLAGVSFAKASNFRRRIERILAGAPPAAGTTALRLPAVQRACLVGCLLVLFAFSLGAGLQSAARSKEDAKHAACAKKRAARAAELAQVAQDESPASTSASAKVTIGCPEAERANPAVGSFNERPRRSAR